MAMEQVEGELVHLTTLLDNDTPSACSLENDLTLKLDAIHHKLIQQPRLGSTEIIAK